MQLFLEHSSFATMKPKHALYTLIAFMTPWLSKSSMNSKFYQYEEELEGDYETMMSSKSM